MKSNFRLLAGALVVLGLSLSSTAKSEPAASPVVTEKPFHDFNRIQVRNFQNQPLGRIAELGVDLVNGRIVEVLVACDRSLGVGAKIVSIPPAAFQPDSLGEVYRLDASPDALRSAPAVRLSRWSDLGQSDRVAAAYRHFGQEPYFLGSDETAGATASRPQVGLSHVQLTRNIHELPVGNIAGERFGRVWSLRLDLKQARILSVIVQAPGNFQTKSVVPATALAYNAARDGLLLDLTKAEYAEEPRYVYVAAAYGQDAYFKQESYQGPRTTVALVQGSSARDVGRTARIRQNLRTADLGARNIEVGTVNGRVTLRGWVDTSEEQRRIGEVAVAASRLELVDNQIRIGKPLAGL